MGLKSIFDGLYVDQLIQKDDAGEFVFYPNGLMGRGYKLPAELEPGIRQRLRQRMLVALVIGGSFGLLVARMIGSGSDVTSTSWAIIVGIGAILFVGMRHYRKPLTVGLEPASGAPVSISEWFRRGRKARPAWTYWTSAVTGAIMLVAASLVIAMTIAEPDPVMIVCGAITLVFGALLAWDGTLGLMERFLGK